MHAVDEDGMMFTMQTFLPHPDFCESARCLASFFGKPEDSLLTVFN